MSSAARAEVCIVACAEAFRGDGEIMASPMGLIPSLGARLAKATFEPELVLTDGVAAVVADLPVAGEPVAAQVIESYMPYRSVFDTLWWGKRHVMMGASQIDRHGNQNIACIGPWNKPKAQLLGVRGAPGNTINHPTSYWIPAHGPRVFVPAVDMVSGIGYDRAAALGTRACYHEIRRVISNLGVFDFSTADQTMARTMRLVSVHPGVTVDEVVRATGFALTFAALGPDTVPETRLPTAAELELIRTVLDPRGLARTEVPE